MDALTSEIESLKKIVSDLLSIEHNIHNRKSTSSDGLLIGALNSLPIVTKNQPNILNNQSTLSFAGINDVAARETLQSLLIQS